MASAYSSKLALFQPSPIERGIETEKYIEYRSTTAPAHGATIEFSIAGNGPDYIDLTKSRLAVKFKITKADGQPLDSVPIKPDDYSSNNTSI